MAGVHIDFPDVHGNTPLHYAAKYGHPDLCKVLIERGSFAGVKNNLGQTAYDVSGTPVVRQYLQPQPFASNTPGDIYCQTQGHMMGNSNYPMPIQPALYGEQPPVYTKPAEQPTSYPQEQQMHAPAVQISPAPMVQGLVINQSNSISTPASPLIMGNNQMKNVHANLFGRNEILLPKTDPSSNSGPPSFNTQPVRQGVPGNQNFPASISPHLPSPNKPQVTAPLQLPSQSPHQLPLPQVVHPSPQRQIHVVPAQQIHQVPAQQIHQVPAQQIHQVPAQQIHQVPPQQIHQVPAQQIHQVPAQQIHQVPAQQIHQVPAQQIHQAPAQKPHNQLPNNFNSAYYPGSSPPVSQPPPIVPQSYKPVAVNGSLSRIIQPGLFYFLITLSDFLIACMLSHDT
jgi:Ankyrin repeats (many copies)